MSDELTDQFLNLDVRATEEGRGFWLAKPWVEASDRSRLLAANVLVVPITDFKGDERPVFPQGTANIVERLRELMPASTNIEVAASEAAYHELALHGDAWRFPTLVFASVLLPIMTSLLANRLDEILPGHKAGDTAEISFIIEAPNHRALKLRFKGAPHEVIEFLNNNVPRYLEIIQGSPRKERQRGLTHERREKKG